MNGRLDRGEDLWYDVDTVYNAQSTVYLKKPERRLAKTVIVEPTIGLQHPSLTDRIYQLLRESIIRHELTSGARLIEQEIASNLGVSRTPIRGAITRLAAEGLVDVVPRRGVFVATLSSKDIKDLYELREVLEVLAVRLAIPLLNDEDISGLKEQVEEFKAALHNREYLSCFELDRKLHDRLAELSGNDKLVEVNRLLGGSIQVSRWIHCKDRRRHEISLQDHRMILDALARKHADTADKLIRDHIGRVRRELLDNRQQNEIDAVTDGHLTT